MRKTSTSRSSPPSLAFITTPILLYGPLPSTSSSRCSRVRLLGKECTAKALLSEYPFNSFFVNYAVYLRKFLKHDLQSKIKNNVIGKEVFCNSCEELFSLMEYLNDFLSIDYEPFQRMIRNVVLTFFLMPLVKQANVDSKSNTYRPNGGYLLLYIFATKIGDRDLLVCLSRLVFQPFFDSRFLPIAEYEPRNLDSFSFVYSTARLFDAKDPLCAKQLEMVYEKVCSRRLGSLTNNSLQELIKQKMESLKLIGRSSEKTFHHGFTQRTGTVSFLPWEGDLERASMSSPFDLINFPSRDRANEVRKLMYTVFEVDL
jgi:hypothetical protein